MIKQIWRLGAPLWLCGDGPRLPGGGARRRRCLGVAAMVETLLRRSFSVAQSQREERVALGGVGRGRIGSVEWRLSERESEKSGILSRVSDFCFYSLLSFSLISFFFRKKLMDFINKIQLHPIVKSNQYEMGHLPSILENLVCIMHF